MWKRCAFREYGKQGSQYVFRECTDALYEVDQLNKDTMDNTHVSLLHFFLAGQHSYVISELRKCMNN
jgi:hypothetical protein